LFLIPILINAILIVGDDSDDNSDSQSQSDGSTLERGELSSSSPRRKRRGTKQNKRRGSDVFVDDDDDDSPLVGNPSAFVSFVLVFINTFPLISTGNDGLDIEPVAYVSLRVSSIIRNVYRVARSRHPTLSPYDPAAFALGSATAMMFIDKPGVVAEPMALPQRVLLPQYRRKRANNRQPQQQQQQQQQQTDDDRDVQVADDVDVNNDKKAEAFGVGLALHRASTTAKWGFVFD